MPFEFFKQEIPEVILVVPRLFPDSRGVYFENYKESDFKKNGIENRFMQDNQSVSKKGVLRGLHFQTNPKAQGKLVRVLNGKVFDVAVDMRKNSSYYGKYVSAELSGENNHMLWIPAGFAHGFYTLEDQSVLLYKTTEEYSPLNESGVMWDDKDLNIKWPEGNKIISDKDLKLKYFREAINNFVL